MFDSANATGKYLTLGTGNQTGRSGGMLGFRLIVSCAVLAVLSMPGVAEAQTVPPAKKSARPLVSGQAESGVQARRATLFQRMLEQPGDLDTAFEYASLSIQVGDLEAAVSTLERMLIFAPGLPRLQLELGLLYYRLTAYETARTYFEAAISGPDVPPEVRARVEQYLDRIDRATRKTVTSGQMRAGIRYQTNANRGPDGEIIILNGLPYELNAESQAKADGNVYIGGVFHVSHRLPQQGTTLEVDLVHYASKQFSQDQFDLAQAELTVGPAFELDRFGYDNAALGVYGILSGAFLHEDYYSTFLGAGARVVSQLSARSAGSAKFEYRRKWYENSPTVPTATDRDGDEIRVLGTYQYIVDPMRTINAAAGVTRMWSRADYLSYTEFSVQIGTAVAFMSPIAGQQKWILGASVGIQHRDYDAPDPLVNAAQAEWDWDYFATASLNVPIRNNLSLLAEVDYRYVDSNYPTREHNNLGTTLSLVKAW